MVFLTLLNSLVVDISLFVKTSTILSQGISLLFASEAKTYLFHIETKSIYVFMINTLFNKIYLSSQHS